VNRSGDSALAMVRGSSPQALNTEQYPRSVQIERGVWNNSDSKLIVPAHAMMMLSITLVAD
jgi:hypothetical protein